jgi:hypothetical protein
MIQKLAYIIVFLIYCLKLSSQTALPPLPEELKSNAVAVVRLYSQTFEIKNIGNATEKIKTIITILNKRGDDEANFQAPYDPYNKVTSANGIVIGSDGKVIKKIKRFEFSDSPAYDGSSFYSELRVLTYSPLVNSYPYTVEYECEINHKGLLTYPAWVAQDNPEVAVENSSFEIVTSNENTFRYLLSKSEKPVITNKGNKISYLWHADHLKAFTTEPFSPSMLEVSPVVYSAPNEFEFHDFKGNLSSWNSFGKWIADLNKGRDQLPAPTISKMKDLIKGVTDSTEMVKRIYSYLQNKTRYVGIQLGIGGYQPMLAEEVDKLGYGDCKALSNYMISLLKAVGIKSNYVLVRAGESLHQINPDFSMNSFNHIIVCVPFSKDSIWLECTSQHAPFGFLGSSTFNRNVLLINNEGGVLVHTPDYPIGKNTQHRTAQVDIEPDGNASAKVSTKFSGIQYEYVAANLSNEPLEQKKWFENHNDIPIFKVTDYHYSKPSDRIPMVQEVQSLQLDKYAGANPNMLIIPLNLMNKPDYSYKTLKQRKTEVEVNASYIDVDTIIYKLPANVKVETLPANAEINSIFGQYSAFITLKENTLMYIRKVEVHRGHYPAEKYQELVEFFDKVSKADKCKAIFNKS